MSSRKHPEPTSPKRARTRGRLLDAAAELFTRDGIAAVSLDQIARHAGVTKGSIYGNFANKDDLVLAVAMERAPRPRPIFTTDAPLRDQLRALVKHVAAKTPKAVKQLKFLIELDLYTLTHEAVGVRLRGLAEERYRKSAENLEVITRKDELSLPPLQFAIAVHALMNGLLYQRAFFPQVVTDAMILKALETLAAGSGTRERRKTGQP